MRRFIESLTFDQWFGNSRVVDENGEPLVVYHGTNQTFSKFSKKRGGAATGPRAGARHGIFFTDNKEEAENYAKHAGSKVVSNVAHYERESERLRREASRLERIAQTSRRDEDWRAYEAANEAWSDFEIDAMREDPSVGVNVISAHLSLQNPLEADFNGGLESEHGTIEDVIKKARIDGHDGAILRNIYDSPTGGWVATHYAAFSSRQIRRVS